MYFYRPITRFARDTFYAVIISRFLGYVEQQITWKNLKIFFFLSTQSGLSIGVLIVITGKKFFFVYFDQKGGPLRKKIQNFFVNPHITIHTTIESLTYCQLYYFKLKIYPIAFKWAIKVYYSMFRTWNIPKSM